jgi:hypothetical protein
MSLGEDDPLEADRPSWVKATMVAQLDLDKAAHWSTEAFSAGRLAEIRDLAQELDVHCAIVAPGSAEGSETLNLVRTLKAVQTQLHLLPCIITWRIIFVSIPPVLWPRLARGLLPDRHASS